jgi:hypothetical protein
MSQRTMQIMFFYLARQRLALTCGTMHASRWLVSRFWRHYKKDLLESPPSGFKAGYRRTSFLWQVFMWQVLFAECMRARVYMQQMLYDKFSYDKFYLLVWIANVSTSLLWQFISGHQALKYLLQGRLTKCPVTLSLGRTYVRWPSVQFWLGNKSEWYKWIKSKCCKDIK